MATADEIRDFNVRYHDKAAEEYDTKWGIDYGPQGSEQVHRKLRKALGHELGTYDRALEIGAGTGYFTLNLVHDGTVREAVATDISPGMLRSLEASAARLGLEVETVASEAEALPFEDESFDLVFGHAVLHHLPDLEASFGEFARVLRPGGVLAFCGEPSLHGDRLADIPKRAAVATAPVWRTLMGAQERMGGGHEDPEANHLEWAVDVHAFTPGDLKRLGDGAGLERVRVRGEELAASWFGWANRTLESLAEPETVPALWRQYAFRGYLALQRVDRALLEPRLPPAIFYNLLVSARKPV
ncbi:MAG: class I SAM-dependent methyltransferase [Thermoleophilaceae bacterium]|nr:class I SAM-dependent methyltransferase [Thermoleophilaceae bacterium]